MADDVVLFVDMLGFGALQEDHPDAIDTVEPIFQRSTGVGTSSSELILKADNPLMQRFAGFHVSLESRIRSVTSQSITAITFSDSAFIRLPSLYKTLTFSRLLMRDMIHAGVPVRMGIGAGSFKALRFMSDISSNSSMHSTQFLGTAVVRSYAAEQGGPKGLRIVLHPSVKPLVNDAARDFIIGLPEKSIAAYAEVSYLMRGVAPLGPSKKLIESLLAGITKMKASAPSNTVPYYDNTVSALRRMKVASDAQRKAAG